LALTTASQSSGLSRWSRLASWSIQRTRRSQGCRRFRSKGHPCKSLAH